MKLTSRVHKVQPSVTLALNARTLELKRQGRDIVSLGVGEPDIDTPAVICDAAIQAIHERDCRYTATAGKPELRQAISDYIKQIYGLHYDSSCVMASCGAKHVLFNAIMAVAEEGDEVLVPVPYWTSYPEFVHLSGATAVFVETREQDDFRLTPRILESAISDRTRAIIFNSPSNPTGIAYPESDLKAVAEVLEAYPDIWVISDDIYCTLLFDGHPFVPIAGIPALADRTIVANGVSKTFSMTGWRIGFAAGPKDVISAMIRIQDHSTSCPSTPAQRAAIEALIQGPDLTRDWVMSLDSRRRQMLDQLSTIPGVVATPPQGAFYLFANVKHYLSPQGPFSDTLALCEGLLMEAGVGVVPGEAFGTPGFVRLSFAVTPEQITEAIGRMRRFLASC